MFALLRFLYDLPYAEDATDEWVTSLEPHALVYVVADKYQLEPLQEAVAENMRAIITSKAYTHKMGYLRWCDSFESASDFFGALKTMLEVTTKRDTGARKVLMDFLIQNIDFFRKQDDLLSLLKEWPEFAIEIISHADLESEAEGFWMCTDENCATNIPSCSKCNFPFEPHFLRRYRYDEMWQCPPCKSIDQPSCVDCRTKITWVPQSACISLDSESEESHDKEHNVIDLDVGLDAAAKANRWHAGS